MSGSNSICVATVLLDSGIVPMQEPVTNMVLEAPGGLVRISADCRNGKAERITVQSVPSFAVDLDASLEVTGLGRLAVDTAYGGDSFVVVTADALGFELIANEARELAETGIRITNAANEQLDFVHPENPDWQHFSFCLFAGPLTRNGTALSTRAAVAIQPGKIDRSPTGTATSARMALLHTRGQMTTDDSLVVRSIIDSQFTGRIAGHTTLDGKPAIIPEISGRGWITGIHQHMLDPDDPWPQGYKLSDTWPRYRD